MPPLPEPLAHALSGTAPDRPPKRERTRRQLLQAAVEALSVHGVAGTTIQEIARVAGMAPATVYNHFRTREELLEALAVTLAQSLNDQIVRSYQHIDDGAQRMSIGIRRSLWLARESPAWTLLVMELALAFPQINEIAKPYSLADLRLGQTQGRFKAGDEEAAIDLVFGSCSRAMMRIALGQIPDVDRYMHELASMLLCALGMPNGDALEVIARPLPPFVKPARDEAQHPRRGRRQPLNP
ncbi:MAG: TetR/AcrR family transcriptional regulator [Burkholderiales bacterium]|nr:TetR/AcrR family transcriptional regulator [Burkholderiales bacterium]